METKSSNKKAIIAGIILVCYLIIKLILVGMYAYPALDLIPFTALAVVLFIRKKGLPILIAISAVLLFEFIQFAPVGIVFCVIYILIIVLSIFDVKKIEHAKARRPLTIILIVLLAIMMLVGLISLIGFITYEYDDYIFMSLAEYILLPIALLFLTLWIGNMGSASNKNDNQCDNYYFVSIVKHVCLLVFTFGIYQLIWIYRTTKFTNIAKGEEERNPSSKLLLCIFIPLYYIYWTYKTALRLDNIAKEQSINCDLGKVCLMLSIFVGILPPILIQEKINEVVTKESAVQEEPIDQLTTAY